MAACFCGCGREIGGLRPRANNEVASSIARDLAVMEGALARGEAGDRTAETQAMADRGAGLLAALTRYLHGEIDRDDLDVGANKEWMRSGEKLAKTLAQSTDGPAWVTDDARLEHLAQSGTRAFGVITDVQQAGLGNERVADLAVTVSVRGPDGTVLELTRRLGVAVVMAPRVGDRVEVAYDPADPDRFVYRPTVELPAEAAPAAPPLPTAPAGAGDDRIAKLRELADLLDQGLLTREEFDAEKARLLAQ